MDFLTRRLLWMILLLPQLAWSETEFTYISYAIDNDERASYDLQALTLALDKTEVEYGQYRLTIAPQMSRDRAALMLSKQRYPNIIQLLFPVRARNIPMLSPIKFPIYFGLLGHRVCFVSQSKQQAFARASKRGDLKDFVFGLGTGWADVDIMKQNGLNVVSVNNYDSLFKMTALGRVDAFCRGAHEIKYDIEKYGDMKGLTLDTGVVINYPLIVSFYMHKNNTKAIERVQRGLQKAFADGSLKTLWHQQHKESIDFVNLKSRTPIHLESESAGFDYRPFAYFDRLTSTYNW